MDTSETYVKMCQKATEIQAAWKPQGYPMHDLVFAKGTVQYRRECVGELSRFIPYDYAKENPEWLRVNGGGLGIQTVYHSADKAGWIKTDSTLPDASCLLCTKMAARVPDEMWLPSSYAIWLPRQDQLQEMILPTIRERYDNKVILGHTLDDINRVANWLADIFLLKVRDYGLKSNSMEQLWLAFVMWERFQKRWNGGDWA